MPPSDLYQVDFEPIGKRVEVGPDTSLLDAARQAGLTLSAACGGNGNCGECRVVIVEGAVSPPVSAEEYILTDLELHRGERLACCTQVQGDVKVHVPRESLVTGQRLQVETGESGAAVDPVVRACHVSAPAPTLHDLRGDLERIGDALAEAYDLHGLSADPAVIRQVPGAARGQEWRLAVFVRGDEIVGVAPHGARPVGLAVDLGTTKIAAYLLDLESGEELATAGVLNPQIGYGEDVISRLVHAARHEGGGRALAGMVREALDGMLGEMTARAGVSRDQVADACIVGNTAMTHLLLEFPTRQLATAPYVAASRSALDVKARDLGLGTAPGAYVHILPCIGGFVGADHVAMILGTDLDRAERVTLGVDIGTNTEIVLSRPGSPRMASVSCASGPAFEGAHISDGMRAASGAIEALQITDSGIRLKTIDDAPAVGLCGSGIVDAVAELRRWGLINGRGRFQREHTQVREGRHGAEYLLVPAVESGSAHDVVITQNDVNEIQLAKGAIRVGLEVLMEITGTAPEEVETVIIAGAFGSYLNLESALGIGLFPPLPNARYRQVGNAAGAGAKRALISRHERDRARQIADGTDYVELTVYPRFNRRFAEAMLLPDVLPPRST